MDERIRELGCLLGDACIDVALLLHPRDILYYAGTARPASLLVFPCLDATSGEGPPGTAEAILFVRRGLERARAEATVDRVEPMQGFSCLKGPLYERGLGAGRLGTTLDTASAELYVRLRVAFPDWEVADISSLILNQRMVKDEDEIEATRGAAIAADAGHQALPRAAVLGMSELELAAEVERAIRLAGHEAYQPLRDPGARGGGVLLMSGENLTIRGGHGLVVTGAGLSPGSPYGPSRRTLREGDLIVLDIGTTCRGYTADESRTFVMGQPGAAHRALFAAASQTEQAVLDPIRPGVTAADVYAAAQAVVDRGAPPAFAPGSLTLPGFVGHGIGLELDEPPILWPRDRTVLQEGMVLAVEVEISAGGLGLMAKLEDTVVIRSDGCEVLTQAPRTLIQCG